MKLAHQRLVDFAGAKIEAAQILVDGESRRLDLIRNRTNLALGGLRLEQLRENGHGSIVGWRALFHQLARGLRHAIHLQAA